MSDIVIKVQNLGKSYRIRHDRKALYQTLHEALAQKQEWKPSRMTCDIMDWVLMTNENINLPKVPHAANFE